jgi:UDP-glucose 4-epimerase
MGKTILITGAAGLLGAHFSRYSLKNGHTVIGIDDLSGGYKDFLPCSENFTFYKRTLGKDPIDDIFEKHCIDTVFHFAAYAAEGLSPFIRCFNYQNNVIASASIVNECINHDCKLIFTSSMAVYGKRTPPFTEELELVPIDPYGIAKLTVEMDIRQAAEQFNLKYNIIRPHNVLGKYQNIWDKYRNVIGIFIRRVLKRKPMIIYGDGQQTRAFSDIEYYMKPFAQLIEGHHNETFNIGADKYWSINEVAHMVKDVAAQNGYAAEISYGEPRHEAKHAYSDHAKAIAHLDFKDDTNLESLIKDMFTWAERQPNRDIKRMPYEVKKNIYEYWK